MLVVPFRVQVLGGGGNFHIGLASWARMVGCLPSRPDPVLPLALLLVHHLLPLLEVLLGVQGQMVWGLDLEQVVVHLLFQKHLLQ